MSVADQKPLAYTKTKEAVDGEFASAEKRHDLAPAEIHNTGFSLEHHERATLAAAERPTEPLGAPLYRSTTAPAD